MRHRRKRNIFTITIRKIQEMSPVSAFIAISYASLGALFILFILSQGDLIDNYFFFDIRDTGMDFFHSIEYVRGKRPYELFNTLYSPLANLFFYNVYMMMPSSMTQNWTYDFYKSIEMRGTDLDLRSYQAPMLMYLLFVVCCTILLFALSEYILKEETSLKAKLASAGVVLSYGCLYAIERGNIVILSAILAIVFVMLYESDNKILKETALLSLAVSAGLKLYPAILGILLIRQRDWKATVRTLMYGMASVILPVFVFGGLGVIDDWLKVVFSFGSSNRINWTGTGMSEIINNFSRIFACEVPPVVSFVLVCLVVGLLLLSALLLKKEWQASMALILAMFLFQSQEHYALCMFLVPLLFFFSEEKKLSKGNIGAYIGLIIMTVNLPLLYLYGRIYLRHGLTQITLCALAIWCMYKAYKNYLLYYKCNIQMNISDYFRQRRRK